MHADDPGAPTRGPTGAGQPAHRLVEERGVALQAAPLLGLQQPEEADVLERLDVLVGQLAQILGFLGARTQGGQQLIDAGQDRLRVTLLNGRHWIASQEG